MIEDQNCVSWRISLPENLMAPIAVDAVIGCRSFAWRRSRLTDILVHVDIHAREIFNILLVFFLVNSSCLGAIRLPKRDSHPDFSFFLLLEKRLFLLKSGHQLTKNGEGQQAGQNMT